MTTNANHAQSLTLTVYWLPKKTTLGGFPPLSN